MGHEPTASAETDEGSTEPVLVPALVDVEEKPVEVNSKDGCSSTRPELVMVCIVDIPVAIVAEVSGCWLID